MIDKEDWIMQRAEEIALQQTGYEFNELSPHMQMMAYMRAEQEYSEMLIAKAEAAKDYWNELELQRRLGK